MKARLGVVVKKNLALHTDLILSVIQKANDRAVMAETYNQVPERNKWTIAGAYLAFSYALALRGNEGFMLDIKQLRDNPDLTNDLVWIVLSGKFKNDATPALHELRSVPITSSGINIKLWRDRLAAIHEEAGREYGPAICDDNGYILSNADMNDRFIDLLESVYEDVPDLFPKMIEERRDIRENINIFRTLRRSSNSRATSMGVKKTDVAIVCRWSSEENSKTGAPSEAMQIAYTEQYLMDNCFRRYTLSM